MNDNTKRFSDRVDNYTKYRPSYPSELVMYIKDEFDLHKKNIIADIGSGTGKFSELLIPLCQNIVAVEPNDEMRFAAETKLSKYENYKSVKGTAENTTLEDGSIDLITVAQAFHWFDMEKARREFKRILIKNGDVLIIANMRIFNTDFLMEYETTLNELIPQYKEVNHYRINSEMVKSFLTTNYKQRVFTYTQTFDWEGLVGRLCSSSYTPKKETQEYFKLEKRIEELFIKYSQGDTILFNYESIVQSGSIQ